MQDDMKKRTVSGPRMKYMGPAMFSKALAPFQDLVQWCPIAKKNTLWFCQGLFTRSCLGSIKFNQFPALLKNKQTTSRLW